MVIAMLLTSSSKCSWTSILIVFTIDFRSLLSLLSSFLCKVQLLCVKKTLYLFPYSDTSRPRYHRWQLIFYMIKYMIRCAYSIQQDTHSTQAVSQSVSQAGRLSCKCVKSEEGIVIYDKNSTASISARARE